MGLRSVTSNIFPLLIALIGIGLLPARADTDFSQCNLPRQVGTTKNLADIPSPVLALMPGLGAAHDAILSDADDPSDPINDNVPSVRLAGAFSEGLQWAIVYETGDFANTRVVALYSVMGKKASLLARQTATQEAGICAILKTVFPN